MSWHHAIEPVAIEVCKRTGIDVDEIKSKTKTRKVSSARRIVWLAMHNRGYGLSQSARLTGFNHATIHYSIKDADDGAAAVAADVAQLLPEPNDLDGNGSEVRAEATRREALFRQHVLRWRELCGLEVPRGVGRP